MGAKQSPQRSADISLPPEIPGWRGAELGRLYQALSEKLEEAKGSGAAAITLQMRILAREIDHLEQAEVTRVDELATRRKAKTGPARPPSRRRQSR